MRADTDRLPHGAEKARSMTGRTWLPIPRAKRPSEISWRS